MTTDIDPALDAFLLEKDPDWKTQTGPYDPCEPENPEHTIYLLSIPFYSINDAAVAPIQQSKERLGGGHMPTTESYFEA